MTTQARSDVVRRASAYNYYGSPADRRREFKKRLSAMGRNGGLKAARLRKAKKNAEVAYKKTWYYQEAFDL